MQLELAQSAFLLLASLAILVGQQIKKHEGATQAVNQWASQCLFPLPGPLRAGPFPRSLVWCEDAERLPMVHLMNHMTIYSAAMDGSIAAEFGVPVRVGYLVHAQLFLINPTHVPAPGDQPMIECTSSVGEEMVTKHRLQKIVLEFLTRDFRRTQRTFANRDACLVQLMLDLM